MLASENQFVTFQPNHRLHCDAEKIARALRGARPFLDGSESAPNGGLVGQVELDPSDIGLMRDGFGMQLQHDRIADPLAACADRFRFAAGDFRSTVGIPYDCEQGLRFRFGQ